MLHEVTEVMMQGGGELKTWAGVIHCMQIIIMLGGGEVGPPSTPSLPPPPKPAQDPDPGA